MKKKWKPFRPWRLDLPINRKGDSMSKKSDVDQSTQVTFNKDKLLGMKRYANRADLLGVLLKPDKTYTLDEVNSMMEDFLKGKVS